MTTITPPIAPTTKLASWRAAHSNRYTFVLSDSRPLEERSSIENSCIRNRKPWLIDNTFYVSSQAGGTIPLTTPNPKEFHELQWRPSQGGVGRFVHEREISVSASDRGSVSVPSGTTSAENSLGQAIQSSRSSLLGKIVDRITKDTKDSNTEHRRRS